MLFRSRDKDTYFCATKKSWSDEQSVSTSTDPVQGVWRNIKLVIHPTYLAMYIDDKLVSENHDVNVSMLDMGFDVESYLGKSFYTGDKYFKGYFDNVNVYNYAYGMDAGKSVFDMSGVKWDASSFVYDGVEKSVALVGLPEGLTAQYTGNKATNVGDYKANVTFVYDTEKFEAPVFNTAYTWSITKADPKITLVDSVFTKALNAKKFSLGATATEGSIVTYSTNKSSVAVVDANGLVSVKGIGKATITVTASGDNFNTVSTTIGIVVNPKKAGISKVASSKRGQLKITVKRDIVGKSKSR